jgi:hypothetical protein
MSTSLVPTNDQIANALKESSGLISYAAKQLNVPIEVLKKQVRRNKYLRNLMLELRESAIDLAEDTLMWRMREKRDAIVAMFVLKCIGKNRGWVDKPEKAGESLDKPVYIKILPVGENGDGKKGVGRPKKATYPIMQAIAPAVETDESIPDAEILD